MIDVNFDIKTGIITERALSPDEIAELEATELQATLRRAEIKARTAARQVILDRLGITADEAALLLGGN
jgi:hypothetical protein